MGKRELTLTSKFLAGFLALGELGLRFFPLPGELMRRQSLFSLSVKSQRQFNNLIYHLAKQGYIKTENKNNQRFIKLTQKGQLEALLAKAKMHSQSKLAWDKKWRLIIFDIPEESRDKRHLFRSLLKQNGFKMLQASVFISPYPLNREAIKFFNSSGLNKYIRILKVEELDNDKDLKKHFGLK